MELIFCWREPAAIWPTSTVDGRIGSVRVYVTLHVAVVSLRSWLADGRVAVSATVRHLDWKAWAVEERRRWLLLQSWRFRGLAASAARCGVGRCAPQLRTTCQPLPLGRVAVVSSWGSHLVAAEGTGGLVGEISGKLARVGARHDGSAQRVCGRHRLACASWGSAVSLVSPSQGVGSGVDGCCPCLLLPFGAGRMSSVDACAPRQWGGSGGRGHWRW